MMPVADRNRPVPSAIDGRPWTVQGSPQLTGATSTKRAEMFVPLIDTPTARFIRNHELVHARITPQVDPVAACKKHGVTGEALQWAEDWRVGRAMERRGLIPEGAIADDEADLIARNVGQDPRMAAGAMMANWPAVGARLRIVEGMVRAGWPRDVLESIEARVESCIDGALAGLPRSRRGRRSGASPILETNRGFVRVAVPLARLFDAAFPAAPSGRSSSTVPGNQVDRIPGMARWAPLADIRSVPLTRAVKPRRPIGRRYSDCGVVPSAVHRLPTDGAIFTTKRRARGGTILCDASGSMSYDDEDIDRILSDAPAAKVAFYAGSSRGCGAFGRIVIGADRGRAAAVRAIRQALPGGNNLVDAPALRWLARQPAPRFWVSDEEVGGMDDFGKDGPAHAECAAICRAAGIRIVRSIDQLK